mmetsp:Transcript_10888/g.16242  ORF Transcript_10888/g.16242 Transcript_10888/m.16242 type:complete len:184 (-) Transcript_10888:285-836(-)
MLKIAFVTSIYIFCFGYISSFVPSIKLQFSNLKSTVPRHPIVLSSQNDPSSDQERNLRLQVAELGSTLKGTNVYFVGMMGTGKSSVARGMADRLGPYTFIDTDAVIEQLLKAPISEAFEEVGEAEFRRIESQVLNELHSYVKLIVATGGGIVEDKKKLEQTSFGIGCLVGHADGRAITTINER